MLIAEDLLVLLTDDRTGFSQSNIKLKPMLGGAVLAELALSDALIQGVTPDRRTAALLALLHVGDGLRGTVSFGGVPPREVDRRSRQLALNDWVAQAVSRAIQSERSRRSG